MKLKIRLKTGFIVLSSIASILLAACDLDIFGEQLTPLQTKLKQSLLIFEQDTEISSLYGGKAHNTPVNTASNSLAVNLTQQPLMVRNGQLSAMHRRLNVLVGEWSVAKTTYIAGGTAEKPMMSNGLISYREWIAETGNRHLRDITQGVIAGNSYYRLGILSYSTMDERYEWNTVDGLNTMMMTYKGEKGSASLDGDIVMVGEFTDQGVLGDAYVGKTIGQRTVIKIESRDRHIIDLYFTPPGEPERLVDRAIYTRR